MDTHAFQRTWESIDSGGPRPFLYFRDRYAFWRLGIRAAHGATISELRRSPEARYLQRPAVRRWLATGGNQQIDRYALESVWPARPLPFTVTLGMWGSDDRKRWRREWHQMSKRGLQLVVQLNFARSHDRMFEHLLGDDAARYFRYRCHPVNRSNRNTLAWVRVELSYETGEALIEEVQSDWVSRAVLKRSRYDLKELRTRPHAKLHGKFSIQKFHHYFEHGLQPYLNEWSDAALFAALTLIVDELRFPVVYYHSWKSNLRLKGFREFDSQQSKPPRSLYTALPKRFGFELTDEAPLFLRRDGDPLVQKLVGVGRDSDDSNSDDSNGDDSNSTGPTSGRRRCKSGGSKKRNRAARNRSRSGNAMPFYRLHIPRVWPEFRTAARSATDQK